MKKMYEDIPLWESVTEPFSNVLDLAFGCHHRKLSRVFTINNRSYKVCCECGATFNYSLETMSVWTSREVFGCIAPATVQPLRYWGGRVSNDLVTPL
jgi:hypothetical protein